MLYLGGNYLEWWFSWFRKRVQKTLKKTKTDRKKHSKMDKESDEYRKSKITRKNIFGFTFYAKILCYAQKQFEIKVVLPSYFICSFYALQGIWNAVMISSYGFALVFRPHDLWPERFMNGLGTTTQIFKTINYLIQTSEKSPHFRITKNHLARSFFSHTVGVTVSMYFENIFWIMCISKI